MLFLHMPAILIALLPIIAVETFVATRAFKCSWRTVAPAITRANLMSMLLGFPLLWLCMVLISLLLSLFVGGGTMHGIDSTGQKVYAVTVQAAWLMPYETELYWMVPCAALVMLVPAFFMSVLVERFFLKRSWSNYSPSAIASFSWKAHMASYLILVLLWLAAFAYDYREQPRRLREREERILREKEWSEGNP